MNKILKSVVSLAVATTLVGAGIGTAVANSSSMLACTLMANVPDGNNNAQVGRSGCSNTVAGTGYIKEDRGSFPDDTVGSKSFQAGISWINGSCGNGHGSYYSRFEQRRHRAVLPRYEVLAERSVMMRKDVK